MSFCAQSFFFLGDFLLCLLVLVDPRSTGDEGSVLEVACRRRLVTLTNNASSLGVGIRACL